MKILALNLGPHFSSAQSTLLKEMNELKKQGAQAHLVALNQPHLPDLFEKTFPTMTLLQNLNELSFLKNLTSGPIEKALREGPIDIVMSYGETKVSTMGWILRKFPRVPLIVSLFDSVSQVKTKRAFFRVDHFLVRSQFIGEDLLLRFGPSSTKITYLPSLFESPESPLSLPEDCFSQEFFSCGAYVPLHLKDLAPIESLCYAFASETLRQKLKLYLFSPVKWAHHKNHLDIRNILKDQSLEESVLLLDLPFQKSLRPLGKALDLWFCFDEKESRQEGLLQAILAKLPCLFPRRPGNLELSDQYPAIGQSYHPLDGRNIRQGLTKLIQDTSRASFNKDYRRIIKDLSPQSHIPHLRELLEEAIKNRRKTP